MALPQFVLDMLADEGDDVVVKRGEEIFEGTDYPRTFDAFVGQEDAKEELEIAIEAARHDGVRLDHTLLASGIAGVGKTTLATLVAAEAGVGLVRTTGPLSQEDFLRLIQPMKDRDILFIDEVHLMGKHKSDWILPFFTEGQVYTKRGAAECPDITIFGATTDSGMLTEALRSRFLMTPEFVAYTAEEGAQICANLCTRMHVPVPVDALGQIATAADQNPRAMRKILSKVRDLSKSKRYADTHPNLDKAFKMAGVSADGLTNVARDILLLLLLAEANTLSVDTIKGKLNEPGPIAHHEKQLLQRQYLDITGRGRRLTSQGLLRAQEEVRARAA